ncbi:c-type cytochrome [Pseudomonas argentinensis]|uniref:c-type cytochrome n=1 Tax=Phytopseudomonas argentinensis TaxID=289370 RepID=UPI0009F69A44|nr:c-type cytochrome [Pseudomonas argentinensis]
MRYILILALGSLSFGSFAAKDPEAVFNRSCGICHNGQLPLAPKKGDTQAWQSHLDQGMDVLLKHVANGYNSMPPGGLCMDCTAQDHKAVIEWMSK